MPKKLIKNTSSNTFINEISNIIQTAKGSASDHWIKVYLMISKS